MTSKLSSEETTIDKKKILILRKMYPYYDPKSIIPIVRGVIGIGVFVFSSLMINNKYFSGNKFKMLRLPKTGWFLLFYLIGIFMIRIYETKTSSVCLELMWGCNISLLLTSIGCIFGKPLLISMSIGLVGLDQIIWHIDIITHICFNKMLIGAAGYLNNTEQGYLRTITSFHHIWFLYLSLNCLKIGKSYIHSVAFPLSMLLGLSAMIYARIATPKCVWFPLNQILTKKSKHEKDKLIIDKERNLYLEYLNINCCFEFYPSVNIKPLHFANKLPSFIYIPTIGCLLSLFSYIPFICIKTYYSDKYLSRKH